MPYDLVIWSVSLFPYMDSAVSLPPIMHVSAGWYGDWTWFYAISESAGSDQ